MSKPHFPITNLFLAIIVLTLIFPPFSNSQNNRKTVTSADIRSGAQRFDQYLPIITGKKVAIVANQTSLVKNVHLVDTLLKKGINIVKIFAPEHGFRGQAEAGEKLNDGKDRKTGIPVISLYGDKYKPGKEDLKGVDIVLFDIQDVGVRIYTYASTMQYIMEACAKSNIPMIVLDRPNPNGYFIDGPVLESKFASFVGLNPIPLVHGMTLGELANMINKEGWLGKNLQCQLTVITVINYNHNYYYSLPVPSSPNLPNMTAVYLYPSLGLFEGTIVSVGRGTGKPFQMIGYPGMPGSNTTFMPVSMPGFALNPPYKDQYCNGYDLSDFGISYLKDSGSIYLFWLTESYKTCPNKKQFFNKFFDQLAGNSTLRKQIINGKSDEEIKESWKPELMKFKKLRKKYILYPDFE